MIQKLTIENFRGIKELSLNDMKRISVLSGKNNAGKSTVLEALFFLYGHADSNTFKHLNAFRGSLYNGPEYFWGPLFYQMDLSLPIRISVKEESKLSVFSCEKDENYVPYATNIPEETMAHFREFTKENYSLSFTFLSEGYQEEGHYCTDKGNILREIKTNLPGNEMQPMRYVRYLLASSARMTSFIIDEMGKLELAGKKGQIINILKELDPAIEDIVTVSRQGITQLYTRTGDQWLPLQYAGDGVLKMLNICLSIMERENGLLLIDEIESGLHYSMYKKIWELIGKYSQEKNCQVVATTHSKEMLEALFDTDNEVRKETNIYTIYKHKGKNLARIMSAEEAENAVDHLGMELR